MINMTQNDYVGVELNSIQHGELNGSICFLKKENKAFEFQKFERVDSEWLDFVQQINEAQELVFIINSAEVLTKTIQNGQNLNEEELFHDLLPTENYLNYYIQIVTGSQSNVHLSIIKKTAIDNFVNQLIESQLFPRAIFLGSNILQPIGPLVDQQKSLFTTFEKHEINQDFLVISTEPNSDPNPINRFVGEYIKSNELLSLSAALYSIYPNQDIQPIHYDLEKEVLKDHRYKKKIKFLSFLGGGILLIMLLFNFFAFTNLQSQNEQLVEESMQYKEQIGTVNAYNQRIQDEKSILKSNPWLVHSKTSFYCDRIMATLPIAIKLQEATFFPLEDEKEMLFNYNQINIIGQTKNSRALNSWMNSLNQLDWIQQIEVEQLQENQQNLNQFQLKIFLNE